MRHKTINQKAKELPQPRTATVQTVKPTPISLNGLKLHQKETNKPTSIRALEETEEEEEKKSENEKFL